MAMMLRSAVGRMDRRAAPVKENLLTLLRGPRATHAAAAQSAEVDLLSKTVDARAVKEKVTELVERSVQAERKKYGLEIKNSRESLLYQTLLYAGVFLAGYNLGCDDARSVIMGQ